ncbi:MAG TPA: hypothetical protein PKE66_09960 [Pyrinomonadaceae bacterium]|nr:hypothetical protein [Pyrinomonadaceae bacterium]
MATDGLRRFWEAGCGVWSPGRGSGGVKDVQQGRQGSGRAGANSNGHVVARTDHQAFGEEIGVGVGLRKSEQGYSADKATRQGYRLTENDAASGQQHTWFRKLETQDIDPVSDVKPRFRVMRALTGTGHWQFVPSLRLLSSTGLRPSYYLGFSRLNIICSESIVPHPYLIS